MSWGAGDFADYSWRRWGPQPTICFLPCGFGSPWLLEESRCRPLVGYFFIDWLNLVSVLSHAKWPTFLRQVAESNRFAIHRPGWQEYYCWRPEAAGLNSNDFANFRGALIYQSRHFIDYLSLPSCSVFYLCSIIPVDYIGDGWRPGG